MKLITYDKPEAESIEVINLTSMILLFVAEHTPEGEATDDAGAKSAKQYLKCVYAAYDEADNIHILVQYYTYGPDEEVKVNSMKRSAYFDGSINSYQLITTINFFTGNKDPESTDLLCYKTEEGDKYEFYAYKANENTEEDDIPVIYTVNEKIKIGLEIIHSLVGRAMLSDSGVIEANIWMYDEHNENFSSYKNLYSHEEVDSYKIRDISKTTKKGKNHYIGAVVLDFITKPSEKYKDGNVYTIVMPYSRTEKLRRKDLTMDVGLMETAYEGAYVIGNYTAAPLDVDADYVRIITYSKALNRYVVFDMSLELHKQFCDDIENIDK